ELEETINFKKLVQLNLSAKQLNKEKDKLKSVWKKRILGCQRDVDTWQQLLDIHSLTTLPTEETKMYLEFASICRTKGQNSKSFNIINKLLRKNSFDDNDIEAIFSTKGNSSIKYAFIKHLRVNGYPHYSRLYAELASILSSGEKVLKSKCLFHRATENGKSVLEKMESVVREKKSNFRETEFEGNGELTEKESQKLEEILVLFEQATQLNPENQKAFHSLALMHYKTASFFDALKQSKKAEKHCVLAARNFFKSFSLGEKGGRNFGTFQDALRVINLLFGSSQQKEVQEELEKGFKEVSVDIWLNVIPQIIARIMDGNCGEQKLVRDLLIHISETHPQSLMYPVTVATKSEKMSRKSSALFVFSRMKARDPELAEQAMLVSDELIRVAIPWPEICAEKLLEASHDLSEKKFDLFDKKVAKFYKLVIEASPKTSYELKFKQAFAADFEMAFDFIKKAQLGRRADAVERSLAINLKLVQRIQKKLSSTEFQDLADVSPALMKCKNLKLI
ncbi:phosphatidylinositol kinase-related protein kinase tor1, partial [Bonamia ostreae]